MRSRALGTGRGNGRALAWLAVVAAAALAVVVALLLRDRPRDTVRPAVASETHPSEIEDALAPALDGSEREVPAEASHAVAVDDRSREMLVLRVSTRDSPTRNAAPVPRIHVNAGVGSARDPDAPVAASGTTDERGELALELPWELVDRARRFETEPVWVRVAQPGYQSRFGSVRLPASPTDPAAITVIAFPGCTLRGRVSDESGRPVAANVQAAPPRADGGLGFGAMANATADGRFDLHVSRTDRYTLIAEAGDAGTAALRNLDLSVEREPERVELVVRGPGCVRGRVHDTNGASAASLRLLVVARELDDPEGSFVLPEPRTSEIASEGRGRSWATIQTGADGSFEARGLRVGLYDVRAAPGEARGYPVLLTPTPVQCDGAPLDLELNRPHLAVRIVDEAGRPWSGKAKAAFPRLERIPRSWPDTPRIVVMPVREEAHLHAPFAKAFRGSESGESSFVFDVPDRRRYTVSLVGGDAAPETVEASVPARASRVEVELRARAKRPNGTLVVSAVDYAGHEVYRDLAIRVEDEASGAPILEAKPWFDESWPTRIAVPEGAYRVIVEGRAFIDTHHGTLMSPRSVGRWETVARVDAGVDTRISAELDRGARVRLSLRGELKQEDRDGWRLNCPGCNVDDLEGRAALADVVLVAPDRWFEPVEFTCEVTGNSSAGTHERPQLPIGTRAVSQVVASGTYEIQARMPGGRIATAPVKLLDGETTDVELVFD